MEPQQTVWLVTQVDHQSGLVGVFSTKEKAETWIAAQPQIEGTDYYADEWKVDQA